MSHVHELYRQEALGLISSREFDRRFDDAVEQDMIDSMAQRDIDAEYEAYIEEARKEYYEDIINSMNPHDRKHELNPGRMDLKGGHRHNHVKNAHERMRRCRICDNPITKYEGFKAPWYGHICLDCYFQESMEEAYMCGIPFGWKKSDNFYRSFIRRARKKW